MSGKVYLIDTENVKSEWKVLLDKGKKKDKLLIFYTENSPNVSFGDFSNLMKYPVKYEMIPCYLGKNGLDFQLVSFLGYLLRKNPFKEYVIVSNDTGFDTVVYFWSAKGKKVNRMSTIELHNLKVVDEIKTAEIKTAEITEVQNTPTPHRKVTTKSSNIKTKQNETKTEAVKQKVEVQLTKKKRTPEKIQQDATIMIKEILEIQKGIDFAYLFSLIKEQGPENMQKIYQGMVKKWGQDQASVMYKKLKPEIKNIYKKIQE